MIQEMMQLNNYKQLKLNRERALRTRELATVCRDVPDTDPPLRSLAYRGALPTEIETLFEELGWDRIATRIPRWRKN